MRAARKPLPIDPSTRFLHNLAPRHPSPRLSLTLSRSFSYPVAPRRSSPFPARILARKIQRDIRKPSLRGCCSFLVVVRRSSSPRQRHPGSLFTSAFSSLFSAVRLDRFSKPRTHVPRPIEKLLGFGLCRGGESDPRGKISSFF